MIPFKKIYTLIGTTDHEVEDFENPKITYEEKTYLINSVNSFIKKEIVDNDIVWTYSGVRPLIEDNNQKMHLRYQETMLLKLTIRWSSNFDSFWRKTYNL